MSNRSIGMICLCPFLIGFGITSLTNITVAAPVLQSCLDVDDD